MLSAVPSFCSNIWCQESCERHSKDDWEDYLGRERRSSIFGREIIGQGSSRREESSVEEVIEGAIKTDA
jgi:hypothetical protein